MEVVVDASFAAYLLIYLVAGIPAVLRWGGDIGDPIDFNNSPRGVFVKLVLIYGTLLDFVLASTTVNRWVMRCVNPSFDYKWTWRNAVAWAKYSLPSSFLAVGMALFIPKVSDRLRERFNVTHTQVVQVVTIQEIQRDTYLQVLVSPGSYYSRDST